MNCNFIFHFSKFNLWYSGYSDRHLGRTETSWRPGQANNLSPPQTRYSLNFWDPGQDWRTFLRARSQTQDNFRRNSFACRNLSLVALYFLFFQLRLCARGSCPADPLLQPALTDTVPILSNSDIALHLPHPSPHSAHKSLRIEIIIGYIITFYRHLDKPPDIAVNMFGANRVLTVL